MRVDHSETGKTRLRRIFVINICVRLPTNSAVSLEKTLSRNMKWLMHIKMNWESSRKQTICVSNGRVLSQFLGKTWRPF